MSVRTEVLQQLHQEAQRGGILLSPHKGRRAERKLSRATKRFNEARKEVMLHEHAKSFSLWVLGGSRENDPKELEFTSQLTERLSEGYRINILTGAGPGIMDAAVEGWRLARKHAQETGTDFVARNEAIGLQVTWEENRRLELFDYYQNHPELMPRVQELVDRSQSAYVGPGGIGTMFELWTLLQLKQMGHLENSYAIIVHPSWRTTIENFSRQSYNDRLKQGLKPAINEDDLHVVYSSESVDDTVSFIAQSYHVWDKEIKQHTRRSRNIFKKRH